MSNSKDEQEAIALIRNASPRTREGMLALLKSYAKLYGRPIPEQDKAPGIEDREPRE